MRKWLQELHMTGAAVVGPAFALVVAEGGPKAHKKYAKLLLHRIDWGASAEGEGEEDAAAAEAAGGPDAPEGASFGHAPPVHDLLPWLSACLPVPRVILWGVHACMRCSLTLGM